MAVIGGKPKSKAPKRKPAKKGKKKSKSLTVGQKAGAVMRSKDSVARKSLRNAVAKAHKHMKKSAAKKPASKK